MSLVTAPVLETENLLLRGPEKGDADAVMTFLRDPIRSAGFGTSPTQGDAWRWFTLNVGHWHWHGYGYFTIVDRASGQPCGITGIWNPVPWPEPELGWVVFEGFEGRSLAYEAAQRARIWAYTELGMTTLTSNIVPSNTRSKALAARLGAQYERTYHNEHMGEDELWRHPSAQEVLG
ncbi:RimJ/RimL family protein N-acetyltransferase [Sagittula marina]|uniref:RimJ/RimL family protein N-acetyltransferase n=1 Tax=Sagittula marina TaxID=943940 RepID=A0A7W6DIX1_9RHOB|nr:GNAT family N-acetyltransferase [Sagittula marina]MBB3984100.1 RimJ/RimL family protein N-acetyltransferase [Sagittula marina]